MVSARVNKPGGRFCRLTAPTVSTFGATGKGTTSPFLP
jgi:hypothetical protein